VGSLASVMYAYPSYNIWDNIYYTIRLFTISANDRGDFLCYSFVALFAFVDTAFLALTIIVVVAESAMRSAVGFALPPKNHVVVLGAGEWGLHYAKALAASNQHVVMVDANPSDQAYEAVISHRIKKEKGVSGELFLVKEHFQGGKNDKGLLKKVNAQDAIRIITMLDNDEENIDAAFALKLNEELQVNNPPTIMLPVDNIRLSASLAVYNRFSEFGEHVEIRSFNIMQQAAVRHFQQYPPELYADVFGQTDIHFAIYGLGDAAINLIYVIGQLCHYRTWDMNSSKARDEVKKVRVTVLDQGIEKAEQEMKCLFPNIDQVIDLHFHICSSSNGIASHDYFLPRISDDEKTPPVTQHFLCFKDEILSVRCAVKLRKQQMKHPAMNTPIFVRSQDGKGLARLIESSCGNPEWPDNIFPYVILSDNLDDDIYFSDKVEKIAKAFNNWEVIESEGDNVCLKEKEKNQQWESLSSAFKHSSFFQAAYLRIRLRAIGYDWIESPDETDKIEESGVTDKVTSEVWLKQGLYQHLALLEHQRYKGERWMMGWYQGERTLGDIARTHPELESLSSNTQWGEGYDINQAKALPSYLKKAGCALVKSSVPSKDENLTQSHVFMFNMLNQDSRKAAKKFLDEKKYGQVIGLLPLPFEVFKPLLPLIWDDSDLSKHSKRNNLRKDFGLLEAPSKDKWIEDTIENITELSGNVDLYIEMPVLHPFSEWLRNDSQALNWLDDASKQTDDYIGCRINEEVLCILPSVLLPKSTLKVALHSND